MTTVFIKSGASDFPTGPGCWPELLQATLNNAIAAKTSTVVKSGDVVTITWDIGLSAPEIAAQDGIIAAHDTTIPWQTANLRTVDLVAESYLSAVDSGGGIPVGVSWTDITFDTQLRADSDYTHTPGTASITVDTTGSYEIQADVTIYQPATGSRSQSEIRLAKNGAFIPGTKGLLYHRNSPHGGNSATVRVVQSLVSGDVVKVQAIKVSGGTLATYPDGCRVLLKRINN